MRRPRASFPVVLQATDIVAVLILYVGHGVAGETRRRERCCVRPPMLHNSIAPYLIRFPLPQAFVHANMRHQCCSLTFSAPSPPF
ncbi:hypothetical protein EDB81DRAFT_781122 [Dactylonectria macrodidyma]|uniref:Uncharacterized protein n=1 Tax=Dactylonectria macrodidyma TaxID=307937 RepID=A0A9P9FN65_9HYPO|nr:hypothetical protein EDB81DRAFT_781122 [Dactylonectria macrodidyma]